MSYDCLVRGGIVQRQNSRLIPDISARLARGPGSNPGVPIPLYVDLWAGTLMVKEAPYKGSFGVQFPVRLFLINLA